MPASFLVLSFAGEWAVRRPECDPWWVPGAKNRGPSGRPQLAKRRQLERQPAFPSPPGPLTLCALPYYPLLFLPVWPGAVPRQQAGFWLTGSICYSLPFLAFSFLPHQPAGQFRPFCIARIAEKNLEIAQHVGIARVVQGCLRELEGNLFGDSRIQ